jgi:hypothetical protein
MREADLPLSGAANADRVQTASSNGRAEPAGTGSQDHDLMDGARTGRACDEQGPAPSSKAVTGVPPVVNWRFAPDDRSRLQRLLRLLFEQDTEQKQAGQ